MKKVITISLALQLIVATVGVTLNKHYCMGRLKSVAIFANATPCTENGIPDPMPCCEDISEQLKVDELTKVSYDFKSSPNLYQLAIISYVLLDYDLFSFERESPEYHNYSPPLPEQNLMVLNQVFRI